MQGIRSDQDQQSVLTWLQAERTVGRSAARRLVTRGVWQSPFPRVPVTHSGTLSPPERAIAALLSCPPGSVLGGWSALAFDGMTDLWTRPPWALVKTGAHKPCRDGVRILHSAALGPADVHPYRSPVRTRSARSLVDPAGATDTAAAARLLLIRGYQHGFTTTALLDQVLRTRGQCRQLGLLRETVLDLEGGIRSLPEREFARPVLPGCRLARCADGGRGARPPPPRGPHPGERLAPAQRADDRRPAGAARHLVRGASSPR